VADDNHYYKLNVTKKEFLKKKKPAENIKSNLPPLPKKDKNDEILLTVNTISSIETSIFTNRSKNNSPTTKENCVLPGIQ
jgi:hypothetical protein